MTPAGCGTPRFRGSPSLPRLVTRSILLILNATLESQAMALRR